MKIPDDLHGDALTEYMHRQLDNHCHCEVCQTRREHLTDKHRDRDADRNFEQEYSDSLGMPKELRR